MSTRSDPAPKATAAALLMMARTASYVPRELPLPSFRLRLNDSNQEETQTQKGVGQPEPQVEKSLETTILTEELDVLVEKIAKSGEKTTPDFSEGKSPPTEKQTVSQIFGKFETPTRRNLMSAKMKEKCYLWATRIRTYADDSTDEYDPLCTLNAQQPLIITAMCLILNQENIKRFQEEIYYLPPNIVNMAIGNHPAGEFLQPKSKKLFNVEDYPMFIPFLDRKKLASHPYIFAPVCYSEHWWIWVADVRKKKFYILDPYHKTCPSKPRMKLNKFIGMPGAPLKIKDREIEPPYIDISGQQTSYESFTLKIVFSCCPILICYGKLFLVFSYDCAVYVMKCLEIIESQKVKRGSMSETIRLAEVDHFRVEFASRILFHDMNRDRDTAIKGSEAMRLSKPSAALLSPYCQVDSYDIDSDSD
ncbi:hypothetical protein Ahy_B10g102085 [Arachis hypogaea]|uniref:Ubiquitin-like protease family profile domain-containing protein n=1 Tax=Arachis hypogaea TaxID=3818 RepID=A0A444X148_ARAHY|nr:hypothetical protein Ahy_B10g102085 [Arachis hypogaea]